MFSFDIDFAKLFDLSHWFDADPGFPSGYYLVLAAIYVAILAASVYGYLVYTRKTFSEHRFKKRVAEGVSLWAGAVAIVALALFALRFAQVPYGSTRILVYLTLLTSVGLAGFLVFYMKRLYPGRLEAYEARLLKARYAPKPKPATPPSVKRKAKARRR
ncbi:MAG: hypothetical protein HYX92_17385 [Chloroflexi bacterium]|nr:hypothetical protein [Chloroflexota bacterium]